jgi:hypothetical protein
MRAPRGRRAGRGYRRCGGGRGPPVEAPSPEQVRRNRRAALRPQAARSATPPTAPSGPRPRSPPARQSAPRGRRRSPSPPRRHSALRHRAPRPGAAAALLGQRACSSRSRIKAPLGYVNETMLFQVQWGFPQEAPQAADEWKPLRRHATSGPSTASWSSAASARRSSSRRRSTATGPATPTGTTWSSSSRRRKTPTPGPSSHGPELDPLQASRGRRRTPTGASPTSGGRSPAPASADVCALSHGHRRPAASPTSPGSGSRPTTTSTTSSCTGSASSWPRPSPSTSTSRCASTSASPVKDARESARALPARATRAAATAIGYPACPNLEDQVPLLNLLQPERIGVTLSDEYQLDPEQSDQRNHRLPSEGPVLQRALTRRDQEIE